MTAIEQFNSDPSVNLYIISAYKTELSKDVNEARNEKLLHKIKFLGKIEASHGWWEGTPEESFVIISRSDLSKILLGLINDPDIDQDAYLVKPIGSVRAHNVYKDGSTEDLGTFERLTPEQAVNVNFKSQPHGVTDWFWRYTKVPITPTKSENKIVTEKMGVTKKNVTETANASTWSDLATMFNVPSKGGRLKLSDFDHLVSKGVAIKEVAIVLANSMLKHLNATWNTIGNDNVDISTYLKPNYPTVRDMLADVKDACLDKINSDMPDEYIDTI